MLGQAMAEIEVPFLPIGKVDARLVATVAHHFQALGRHTVEHLKLDLLGLQPAFAHEDMRQVEQRRIMRGNRAGVSTGEQLLHASAIDSIEGRAPRLRYRGRFLEGAFDQADTSRQPQYSGQVSGRAVKIRLEGDADMVIARAEQAM